jgi:hypothetical protein
MAVHVDALFVCPSSNAQAFRVGLRHGHQWCHLFCDPGDEEQLHMVARKVGMKREWFQNRPGFPHYDLVPPKREKAVTLGVTQTDLSEWLRARRAKEAEAG